MAKNLPAREKVHKGNYGAKGKTPYQYHDIRRPLSLTVLMELHTARVEAFGPGYSHEDKDLARIAAMRSTQARYA